MKKIAVAVMFLLSCSMLHAWEKTQTLINSQGNNGMLIGPVLRFTQMDGRWGLMYGARAGLIVDQKFSVGGALYGLAQNTMKSDYLNADGDKINHTLGYGGLEFEYVINSDDLVHAAFSGLLGVGSMGLGSTAVAPDSTNGSSSFYVFEPGISAVVNISKNFRLWTGLHYRLVTGVDSKLYTNENVNGPSFSVGFILGVF